MSYDLSLPTQAAELTPFLLCMKLDGEQCLSNTNKPSDWLCANCVCLRDPGAFGNKRALPDAHCVTVASLLTSDSVGPTFPNSGPPQSCLKGCSKQPLPLLRTDKPRSASWELGCALQRPQECLWLPTGSDQNARTASEPRSASASTLEQHHRWGLYA